MAKRDGLLVVVAAALVVAASVAVVHGAPTKQPQSATQLVQAEEDGADQVVLVPSKSSCELGEQITVGFERVSNTREDEESSDFIGLFRKADPTALVPFDVAPIGEQSQTGERTLHCRRTGDMEVRMVRSPGKIIGAAPLRVFGQCLRPDCSNHGTCKDGACKCNEGWEGEACDMIVGEGLTLAWEDNPKGEFTFGDTLKAKVFHSKTTPESNGLDAVGVFREKDSTRPVQSVFIPEGGDGVELELGSEAGEFFLKLTSGVDGSVLATSEKFAVYPPCPVDCSFHGQCEKGKCVCDSGFDRDDCSRGPGVVSVDLGDQEAYAGTGLNVQFTRDETVAGQFSDRDWLGVYKYNDESTDNPENFAFAIATHVYDPDVRAKLNTNDTHGTVQLVMPFETGKYVVKYVRQDHAQYFKTDPFTVYAPCNNNCSSRGLCSKGECDCFDNWEGDECQLGIADFTLRVRAAAELYVGDSVTVNFTRPAGANTDYDYIGLYTQNSKNNSDGLYSYAYAIAENSNDSEAHEQRGSVQLPLPTDGILRIKYVNAYTLKTEVEADKTVQVYQPCPNECSQQGKCVKGKCECDSKWKGDDCSMGAGTVSLAPTEGVPVVLRPSQLGFQVHVKRPENHFSAGDFVALLSEDAADKAADNLGYSYAKLADESDVFLIVSAKCREAAKSGGRFVLKYFNPFHKELGTSDAFSIKLEDQ